LDGLRVAIPVTDGFEQVELEKPRKALDNAGANTEIVSPAGSKVKAWNMTDWGSKFRRDIALSDARPDDFDALLLPGGVLNPDSLRIIPEAVAFVKAFLMLANRSPLSATGRGPCWRRELPAGAG
jgi:protease I